MHGSPHSPVPAAEARQGADFSCAPRGSTAEGAGANLSCRGRRSTLRQPFSSGIRSMHVRSVLAAALAAGLAATPARAELRKDGTNTPAHKDTLLDNLPEMEALLNKAKWDARRGAYVAPMSGGREAELTLDRNLQTGLDGLLSSYKVPAGA